MNKSLSEKNGMTKLLMSYRGILGKRNTDVSITLDIKEGLKKPLHLAFLLKTFFKQADMVINY